MFDQAATCPNPPHTHFRVAHTHAHTYTLLSRPRLELYPEAMRLSEHLQITKDERIWGFGMNERTDLVRVVNHRLYYSELFRWCVMIKGDTGKNEGKWNQPQQPEGNRALFARDRVPRHGRRSLQSQRSRMNITLYQTGECPHLAFLDGRSFFKIILRSTGFNCEEFSLVKMNCNLGLISKPSAEI